jgi:glucosamine--fructose-6-phosphate aminotransferase (isomerizing)
MSVSTSSSAYLTDILDQPRRLRALLLSRSWEAVAPLAQDSRFERIVLTGMGASLFALWPAWLILAQAGQPAWLVETGELLHATPELMTSRTLVVAASQSGRSAEVVALGEHRSTFGMLVGLTNDSTSPLGQQADVAIDIESGEEHAVSTRSYVNTLAAGALAADILTGQTSSWESLRGGVEAIDAYLETWRDRVDLTTEVIGLPQRLFLLGRGVSLAAAHCGALVIKEAAKWPAEAMSSGQFRHGPLELADPLMTAVILAGHTVPDRERNVRLRDDIERYGGRAALAAPGLGDARTALPIASTEGPALAIAEVIALQLLSVAIAEQTGIEPGVFRHLGKITTVE